MAPGRVLTCVARVSAGVGTRAALHTLTAKSSLDETVEMLGQGSLDVIVYLEVRGYGRLFLRGPSSQPFSSAI
jgi:hypothetical protein